MIRYIGFFSLFILLFLSCTSTKKVETKQEKTKMYYSIVLQGEHSSIKERKNEIFHSKNEFIKVFGNNFKENNFQNIDFDREMLIGIFLGRQSSGGIKINIDKINEKDKEITVRYHIESSPIATLVMTAPYIIIKIPRTDKKVIFQGE